MNVAVITPYFAETLGDLNRCHASVLTQQGRGFGVRHFMIQDGKGRSLNWDAEMLSIPHTGDYGSTPRLVGAAVAAAQGYDAIAFLDGDNWYDEGHLAACVEHWENGMDIVTTGRDIWTPNEELLGHDDEVDGKHFVDVSCMFIGRRAFPLMKDWGFQTKQEALIGDRIIWNKILGTTIPRVHLDHVSVNYTTNLAEHYLSVHHTPPPTSRIIALTPEGYKNLLYKDYLVL